MRPLSSHAAAGCAEQGGAITSSGRGPPRAGRARRPRASLGEDRHPLFGPRPCDRRELGTRSLQGHGLRRRRDLLLLLGDQRVDLPLGGVEGALLPLRGEPPARAPRARRPRWSATSRRAARSRASACARARARATCPARSPGAAPRSRAAPPACAHVARAAQCSCIGRPCSAASRPRHRGARCGSATRSGSSFATPDARSSVTAWRCISGGALNVRRARLSAAGRPPTWKMPRPAACRTSSSGTTKASRAPPGSRDCGSRRARR